MLLPRDYYEAPSLQLPVTEPCAHVGHPQEKLVWAAGASLGLLTQEPWVQGFSIALRIMTAQDALVNDSIVPFLCGSDCVSCKTHKALCTL